MNSIHPKIIRQVFTLLLIFSMGGLIFKEMMPYLSGVLGAITLFVLLKGYMEKLVARKWKPSLAAGLLMFLSFITILLPIAGIVIMLGNKIGKATAKSEKVITAFKTQLNQWEHRLGFNIANQIDTSSISNGVTNGISSILGSTLNTFIAISIMYFILFYMLTNERKLKKTLIEYIPLSKENLHMLNKRMNEMVRSNSLGIPLVAIAQGGVSLVGFFIFGIESPVFWAVVVAIGSMIPFIGSLLGIIPVFLLAMSNGDTFQAWGVLLYGMLVVGSADNIIRLFVLQKLDNVHPLITLLGVIIGIPLFGFVGLIFGPLLISLFLLVIQIYKKEYAETNKPNCN
ncbi:AI-2E family transporter [Flavobacterium sp.]|uniref:AI-2E family transporter n=1 Tax=Flavobacterium sp. TaxID=239 RepID=UPI003C33616E